jgi:hypothetical protein
MPRGKPKKRINPHIAKPYKAEYAEIAERLKASGAQEMDIAYLLGTSTTNLRKWKIEHEEFAKAINRGDRFTLAYLIGKGIQKAGGYDWIEERRKYTADSEGNPTGDVEITRTNRHVPADGTLLMFLAGCIDRKLGNTDWQSKQFIEKKEERTIKVINGDAIASQIEKLGGKWGKIVEAEFMQKEHKLITGDVDAGE